MVNKLSGRTSRELTNVEDVQLVDFLQKTGSEQWAKDVPILDEGNKSWNREVLSVNYPEDSRTGGTFSKENGRAWFLTKTTLLEE
jgi:hypothetical protein